MLIKARVSPGSRKAEIKDVGGRFLIKTRAAAKGGRANEEALAALSAHLKIPRNKLRLINGHQRPQKTFEILPH